MPMKPAFATITGMLLMGCTAMPTTPPPHEPAPPPPAADRQEDTCGAQRVQAHVGEKYSEALGEALEQTSGAQALRVMRPGYAYTLEYRAERLNVRLDEDGVITAIGCG
ncbi:hypothetical protein HOP52_18385 [Halomonas campisalis]|uniref:Peptidase inhibitor I78 family protein n=1 Tax=Billgrantia campisalis TaxID=74661 RepID=A0ABS9PDA8_9GAMM|nr:I78 family peptidase inhibitor [Halomonas campisalis]MCG6659721.1 hypothetical protein [Halomonas campisalis]MDR5864645.1 I78 family peptidase inhibitor [Halomonas campisalis]